MLDMILEGKNDFSPGSPPFIGLSQVQLGLASFS